MRRLKRWVRFFFARVSDYFFLMQASVVVVLGLAVVSGLLYALNDAVPLPTSLERWILAIAAFISQDLGIEIMLTMAAFLIIKWWRWRRSRTGSMAHHGGTKPSA